MMDRKTRARFDRVRKAAASTRSRLEDDMGMEKFGYEKDKEEPGVKTAADRSVCPRCGSPTKGNPPVCPKCGSEPFEKKEEKKG